MSNLTRLTMIETNDRNAMPEQWRSYIARHRGYLWPATPDECRHKNLAGGDMQ
jgi:hypothetical protein